MQSEKLKKQYIQTDGQFRFDDRPFASIVVGPQSTRNNGAMGLGLGT